MMFRQWCPTQGEDKLLMYTDDVAFKLFSTAEVYLNVYIKTPKISCFFKVKGQFLAVLLV